MVKYNDTPVKLLLYPAILFLVIGMSLGVFISINAFVLPDYFSGEYFTFGRVRPVHVGTVAILWLLAADLGLFFFFIPRLCGVSIWSPKLAYWGIGLFWVGAGVGVFSYPWGTNFGWEYAELPNHVGFVPTKIFVTLSLVLIAINIFMTIANRRFEKLYVSVWYAMGSLIWGTFTFLAGSYFVDFVHEGISRVNVSFFYVHNLVGLIYTPMGLATAYYYLPKLAKTPIYSHRLSMVGFWSIAFVYGWIGAHHMIHGPISQWLQTVSIIFSIWLFIPVFTVVTNLFMTLRGHWSSYIENTGVRYITMGNIFYLITCIQGPTMALRNVNEVTSKTDWVIGHAHIALYATFTFFALGGIYYTIPAITKKPLWSEKLASWSFTLNVLGSLPFILPLWLGGFHQGMLWAGWADGSTYAEFHNNLSVMPFLETIAEMRPYWILRSLGGIIILVANIIFALNIFNTVMLQPEEEEAIAAT